jgi:biotin-(acetyl-CoA carboxylase) ligase
MFNVVSTVCADGYKVAGVLIESAPPYALIGLGVNVRQSPTVPASGPERGTTEDISCMHCAPLCIDQVLLGPACIPEVCVHL